VTQVEAQVTGQANLLDGVPKPLDQRLARRMLVGQK
jgi:hypothetical protein